MFRRNFFKNAEVLIIFFSWKGFMITVVQLKKKSNCWQFVCLSFYIFWTITFIKMRRSQQNVNMMFSCRGFHCILKVIIMQYIYFWSDPKISLSPVVIYCFFKSSEITTKFLYVFNVINVTLFAKNNNYIIQFCKDATKVKLYYHFFSSQNVSQPHEIWISQNVIKQRFN